MINFSNAQGFQGSQRDFGIELQQMRLEAALGQTAMHRHLTAFKADLVVATGTGLLTLVSTTSCFAQTGANTATNATLGVLCALCGFDVIEFHHQPLREL